MLERKVFRAPLGLRLKVNTGCSMEGPRGMRIGDLSWGLGTFTSAVALLFTSIGILCCIHAFVRYSHRLQNNISKKTTSLTSFTSEIRDGNLYQ